jgi:hypothetical protein
MVGKRRAGGGSTPRKSSVSAPVKNTIETKSAPERSLRFASSGLMGRSGKSTACRRKTVKTKSDTTMITPATR